MIPIGLFAALVGAFFGPGLFRENPDALPSVIEGSQAPKVAGVQLPGLAPFDDTTLRDGDVKLVNFWASWCVPCRAEHPMIKELAENNAVYGVNYKDETVDGLGFLAELGDPFAAHIADATGRMGINWGLYGVPETYVIAGDGTVVLRWAGPITRAIMENTIEPAIAEAQAMGQ
jgi:cytochrome c biogenesis protein CcmG/thiol:disulfide interchange protein DsbE